MKPVNGTELVRRLNKIVNETIDEWAKEQDFKIKHDGALLTIHERHELLLGFELVIRYPFVITIPKYDEFERGERS